MSRHDQLNEDWKGKMLILPKRDDNGVPYLSYSQISTWKRSKKEYIKQYFMGDGFDGNDYTRFGNKVGEALEKNDFSEFDKDDQEFLGTIPRYDRFELFVTLKLQGFYIKGYVDTAKLLDDHVIGGIIKGMPIIADYKTGDIEKKTSEYSSEDYIQLDIYAAAVKQIIGRLPEDKKGDASKD